MTSVKLTLNCPPMAVFPVSRKLRRTAAEPMTANLTWPDFTGIMIYPVLIPATDVHRKGMLHWQVDACIGAGQDASGNSIVVNLPVEPVLFNLTHFDMEAQPITAPVTVTLADGRVGTGSVVFPICRTSLITGIAEAVIAQGSVEFQDG